MAIIGIASIAGSPGVTTTAVGLAWHWPRPVVLLEADTSNVSALLPGVLRGRLDYTRGLSKAMVIHTRGEITSDKVLTPEWMLSIPVHDLGRDTDLPLPSMAEGHRLWIIPGFDSIEAAAGTSSIWESLVRVARTLGATSGTDMIVDLGRIGLRDQRQALIDACDQLVILTRPGLTDLFRASDRLRPIRDRLNELGRRENLVVARVEGYPGTELNVATFRKQLGIDVLSTTLPHSLQGAAAYSDGIPDRKRKSGYRNAIEQLARELGARIDVRYTQPAQTGAQR